MCVNKLELWIYLQVEKLMYMEPRKKLMYMEPRKKTDVHGAP